jgi:methylenetetrahydrofolate--tRNA-(uracil-5-)-methyltransferase
MKPVGLNDPKTGKRFHAVVQLRPENRAKTAYNLVGFQTKLKYGEQSKVFRLIPALRNAEFLRMGSIHRNTYVCGPRVLNTDLSLKKSHRVFLAGQITGVEGYLESAACGLLAALSIASRIEGKRFEAPPVNTALGALLSHVIAGDAEHYQPSNIHFGLFDPATFETTPSDSEKITGKNKKLKKENLRQLMSEQTLVNFKNWIKTENPPRPDRSLS